MNLVALSVEQPWEFYCPKTGQLIIGEEEFFESPAMLFCYVGVASDFEYVEDWVRKMYDECEENDTDFDYFDRFLEKMGNISNVIIFEITFNGMACGPASDTIYIGIDMDYESEEKEE